MIQIPKIMHFIWVGNSALPPFLEQCIQTWKQHHPHWEIILWDDNKVRQTFFNPEHSTSFLFNEHAYLNAASWAQKADLLRLEILFWFGGVYVDTDFICLKNIDELLHNHAPAFTFWSHQQNGAWIDNGIIASAPTQKTIWKAIIHAGHNCQHQEHLDIVQKTGPGLTTQMWKNDNRMIKLPYHLVYPFSILYGEDLQDLSSYPDSYAVHLYLQSYRNNDRLTYLTQKVNELLGHSTFSNEE